MVLAGLDGWIQVLPFSFIGYIIGRTLLYIGSILSRNLNTWWAWLMSLFNHLHHIVHAHAPYSVGLWCSPTLRAKQPCHADVGLCEGGHLWLRFTLYAGVTLCYTTCLTSYRPYGAPLPHPTSSHNGVASRHREERSDPFMTDLWKINFQNNIQFISSYLSDNKRQQTTAVDYKRLING